MKVFKIVAIVILIFIVLYGLREWRQRRIEQAIDGARDVARDVVTNNITNRVSDRLAGRRTDGAVTGGTSASTSGDGSTNQQRGLLSWLWGSDNATDNNSNMENGVGFGDTWEDNSDMSGSNISLICKTSFPIYRKTQNKVSTVYFYEDAFRTALYARDNDGGGETYMLSDKAAMNETETYSVEPNGSCYGYTSESVDPKYMQRYSPFSCAGDNFLYGFCPVADYARTLLLWNNGAVVEGQIDIGQANAFPLEKQYGRGYATHLVENEPGTLLNDPTYALVPVETDTALHILGTLEIPIADTNGETFTYTVQETDTLETIAQEFAVNFEDIYYANPSLQRNYTIQSCLRVTDIDSPYRTFCVATSTCSNIGENTTQPVDMRPFDLSIFNPPRNCVLD